MKENDLYHAATVFARNAPGFKTQVNGKITVTPISGGLINHSWHINFGSTSPFLLQQINTNVFSRPEAIQHNYILISQFASSKPSELRLPLPLYYNKTETLYIDGKGNYWRAFEFIGDAFSPKIAENSIQVKATAETFGKLTAILQQFAPGLLKIVIPDFHNLGFRYRQFEESLESVRVDRMNKSVHLVEELKKRTRYRDFYEMICSSIQSYPLRVMHHDAKIANVLFSKESRKVICAVDFDTIMPGYYFSDLGDMIRSMACSLDETSTQFDDIFIKRDFYNAIIDGYLGVMRDHLTIEEIKHIHHAGLIMIYMQALRYTADYLNGDIYYHVDYAEQNHDRAMNQLTLLHRLESFLSSGFKYRV